MADFSSRGPLVHGDLKPDVVAPGVDVVAARAAGTSLGDPVDDNYTALAAPRWPRHRSPGWRRSSSRSTPAGPVPSSSPPSPRAQSRSTTPRRTTQAQDASTQRARSARRCSPTRPLTWATSPGRTRRSPRDRGPLTYTNLGTKAVTLVAGRAFRGRVLRRARGRRSRPGPRHGPGATARPRST